MALSKDPYINWSILVSLVYTTFEGELLERYIMMLKALRDNTVSATHEGAMFLGLRDAPAARKNHHAFRGGLIYHMLEMWEFHQTINPTLPTPCDDRLVLQGIIHHDLHKAYRTYLLTGPVEEWNVDYDRSEEAKLMPDDVKSLWILGVHGLTPPPVLTNALFHSHGGFSELQPKTMTPLAKYLYLLDELSGNVAAPLAKRVQEAPTAEIAAV